MVNPLSVLSINRRTLALVGLATGLTLLGAVISPVRAQHQLMAQIDEDLVDLSRAKNLARQAGERVNGGIIQYRAEAAMHGPAEEAPFVQNPDGSWTFTFQGCSAALIDVSGQCSNYTVETVVTVTPERDVTVNANRSLL